MNESVIMNLITSGELGIGDIMTNQEALQNKRQISYHEASESNPRAYYYTTTNDGKRIQAKTKRELLVRLTEHYESLDTNDYTFEAIFQKALELKIKTEAPKEKTVRDYMFSYKAFIDSDLSMMDVRKITPSFMKEYIQEKTQKLNITEKRLYKFKGVLNLVFDYACDPEFHIVDVNPVPKSNRAYKKNLSYSSKKPEDKCFQPEEIERIKKYLWNRIEDNSYDVNAFAILFSIETGMREAEIPSLKWADIHSNYVHIHSQQLDEVRDGVKTYYYEPSTKNEKGISRDGRKIPLTKEMKRILTSLKEAQDNLDIYPEWVFSKKDGEWTTTVAYYEALYKVAKKLGLKLSNNHAFRMALNSYTLIPLGIEAPDRAKFLGHSVETNLRYYTFARDDSYLDEMANLLNNRGANSKPTEFYIVGKKKRA